jgi:hypothetical protein
MKCPHLFEDKETAIDADGLCPLCLAADLNRVFLTIESVLEKLRARARTSPSGTRTALITIADELANAISCQVCGGSGFSGVGTGYDDVCSECGGQGRI